METPPLTFSRAALNDLFRSPRSRQMLPELRTDLFGKNENRKFYTVSTTRLKVSGADAAVNLSCRCCLSVMQSITLSPRIANSAAPIPGSGPSEMNDFRR